MKNVEDIADLKKSKHSHTNKSVLDSLSKDTDGDLNFEGKKIKGGGGASDAFTKVKVGATTLIASGEDTVELVAGTNVTLQANEATKSVVISSSGGGGGSSTGDMLKSEFVLPGGRGQVLSAKNADEATHATSADTATSATTATNATEANHALEADNASEADHSATSDYALQAANVGSANTFVLQAFEKLMGKLYFEHKRLVPFDKLSKDFSLGFEPINTDVLKLGDDSYNADEYEQLEDKSGIYFVEMAEEAEDISGTVVTFNSETDIDSDYEPSADSSTMPRLLQTGEQLGSIVSKVVKIVKAVKFLVAKIGDTRKISGGIIGGYKYPTVGDGTVTGAIAALNDKLDDRGTTTPHSIQTTSVPTATFVTTDRISLPKGTYLVTVDADFGTDATAGARILLIDDQETQTNTAMNSVLSSGRACLNKSRIIILDNTTTLYMRVYQATGKTLTVTSRLNVARLA